MRRIIALTLLIIPVACAAGGIKNAKGIGRTEADACESALMKAENQISGSERDLARVKGKQLEVTEKKCDCREGKDSPYPWSCTAFVSYDEKAD